jgi:hypothetical protein
MKLIAELKARLATGTDDALSGVTLHYSVSGGAPSQILRKLFQVDGNGAFSVSIYDEMNLEPNGEASIRLSNDELRALLDLLLLDFADHITDDPPLFVPDTLIGSIKFRVNDQEARIIFNGSEKLRRRDDTLLSPSLEQLIKRLDAIAHRLLSPDDDTHRL